VRAEHFPVRLVRAAFGLLALASVVWGWLHHEPDISTVNYFSYFTTLSNIIGGLALLLCVDRRISRRPSTEWLRGAATLYLVITGVIYAVLLGGETHTWVNWVHHRIMPVFMPLDWLLIPMAARPRFWRTLGGWLVFPIAYLGYVMAHGAATGWYPYPFLNLDTHPAATVWRNIAGVSLAFIAVAAVLLLRAGVPPLPQRRGEALPDLYEADAWNDAGGEPDAVH
jgi:hypothetical protein